MGVARIIEGGGEGLNVKRVSSMGSLMMKWKLSPGREAAEGLWNGDRAKRLAVSRRIAARICKTKTWVTRKGIYIDRIASAWLVRRLVVVATSSRPIPRPPSN